MHREIMGVQIEKREDLAIDVQDLLTKHGKIIRTRLGLHEPTDSENAYGLIILDFVEGATEEIVVLKSALESYDGVTVKSMKF